MIACLIFALLAEAAGGALEEAPLEPLNSRLEQAEGLAGRFRRLDYRVLTMESDTSRGSFLLANPNLFLLEFTDPSGRRMGFDGTDSYTVEPSSRQVMIYSGQRPSSFLGTLGAYRDSSLVDSVSVAGDSVTVWLEGHGGGIRTVVAGYTLSDSLPFLYATEDANGNRITYLIDSVRVSGPVDLPAFALDIPEGYAVARP